MICEAFRCRSQFTHMSDFRYENESSGDGPSVVGPYDADAEKNRDDARARLIKEEYRSLFKFRPMVVAGVIACAVATSVSVYSFGIK